jgi:hypothetical protein
MKSRPTDPAIEQLDEWYDRMNLKSPRRTVIHKSNRRMRNAENRKSIRRMLATS